MKITVHHYGAFRKLGDRTDLDVPLPTSIETIRAALVACLGASHQLLVEDSALANEVEILPDEYIIEKECALSILPPVCGG